MTTGTVKIMLKLVAGAVGGGTSASSSTDKKVNTGWRGVRRCKEKEKTNGMGAQGGRLRYTYPGLVVEPVFFWRSQPVNWKYH